MKAAKSRLQLPATKKSTRPQAIVVCDPTFRRAVADKVVALDLGKDVELAFLQAAPTIKRLIDVDDESEQVHVEGGLSEVARIRVAGPVALAIAVNIIETLVGAGKVKLPAFKQTLDRIFEAHRSDKKESAE